ncbi:ribonuclease E inhibitor RraB [Maribacter algicola]|uniref:ribonuclease E inhibitor RraB n=1 Tax=Maribacter algicola TaxID=2498892 RepID=UPI00140425C0|nr:ribonuclease E inhibitor RraB [Maribacter algicola]
MIDKSTILEVFEDIRQKGEWDINRELLYGYFFLDENRQKLKTVGDNLKKNGYTFVDIFKAESEENEKAEMYYLHIEKVEIHSVDSLFERNIEFYKVAEKFGINSYDGFDIGDV